MNEAHILAAVFVALAFAVSRKRSANVSFDSFTIGRPGEAGTEFGFDNSTDQVIGYTS